MNQSLTTIEGLIKSRKVYEGRTTIIGDTIEAFDYNERCLEISQWIDVKDSMNEWVRL